MGRRTKEELISSNYYEWLEYCNALRAKKKDGVKLLPAEKAVLKNIPSPESPFASKTEDAPVVVKKKKPIMKKIDFDKNVSWPEKAGSFLCAVYNIPHGDEQCLLFCSRDDCPFINVGYFRSHGIKF